MNVDFEGAYRWRQRKQAVFSEINKTGLPLVLFGYSNAIDPSFINEIKAPLRYICDNSIQKQGKRIWGLEVIDPTHLSELYHHYNVLILVPFEHQIIPQLQALPTPPDNIWRLDLYFDERGADTYFKGYEEKLTYIYDKLSDALSKQTFESVINYQLSRETHFLTEIALPRDTQYFPDTLDGIPFLSEQEVFVDAGAFIGDTIEKFCLETKGKYHSIYAFEPDSDNFSRLESNVKRYPNIHCTLAGTGVARGYVQFTSDESGSRVDPLGINSVLIDSLDCMLEGISPTYIKMDVEGMECHALKGAGHIIRTHHPKLAICTYHSNSDMVQVPLLIQALNPAYQLYFRHYSNSIVETVCYAIQR